MSAQSGFVDPFDYSYQPTPKEFTNIDSGAGKFGQFLGLVDRNDYDRWLAEQERNYERASVNSARAWDEYIDSTKYQRAVKDLQAAGLNPYLALQSGVSAGASSQTASSGSSARAKVSKSDSKLSSIAMLMLASAKIIAMLA